MKLRTKIILMSITACFLPICLLFSLMYVSVQRNVDQQAQEFCRSSAQNLTVVLNQAFDSAYDASLAVLANKPVREYLTVDMDSVSRDDAIRLLENAQNALYTILSNNHYISSISLFSLDNRSMSWGRAGTLFAKDREKADALDGKYFWGTEEAGTLRGSPYLCRLLRDGQRVKIHWGYVKIYLYPDEIRHLLASSAAGQRIDNTLVDSDGRTMFSPQDADDTESMVYVVEQRRDHADWRLVTRLNRAYTYDIGESLANTLYLGLVISVFAVAALSLILSHLLTQPIRRIGETMRVVGSGQFGAHLELNSRDELGALALQLNRMSDELERLFNEALSNHTMFIQAKLNALQSQVNPHFLYNTLDNIHWMCEVRHEPEISRMVFSLSNLFKLALSTDETGVWPLSKEIEHVRCYLDILNIRYQDAVEFRFQPQEGLEDIEVPALMLQPLIENAVHHGVRNIQHGIVQVDIHRADDLLIYRVRDNGTADADYINALILKGPEPGSRKGQALHNLYQRITLRFGQAASFRCISTPEGSLFELTLPIGKEEARP